VLLLQRIQPAERPDRSFFSFPAGKYAAGGDVIVQVWLPAHGYSPHVDPELLARLMAQHLAPLRLFAAQWTDAPEDCVQEVCLQLWRRFDDFDEGGSFSRWARGFVRKVVKNHHRKSRAQFLADSFGGKCVEWSARNVPADILVNCTPVGMHPNVDETPFNKSHLKPAMIVFATVYNPESTLLLKEARSHGCRVVTGVEMFIRQAALQFLLFTGQDAPEPLMRETLKRAIGPVRY
jgi:hypothetical protein